MNNYEGLFIVRADLGETETATLVKSINDELIKQGAQIKKEEAWGKRPLSYIVKKCKEGYYYKVDFESEPAAIAKAKEHYSLQGEILRVMVTKR